MDKAKMIDDRFKQFLTTVQSKTANMKEELAQKEVAECTFAPKTNVSKSAQRRTVEQFLEEQEKHVKHKADFVALMKEEHERQSSANEEGNSYKPKINKVSQRLEVKEPAHERLYKLAKKDGSDESTTTVNESVTSETFHP
jgi:hypothetical protein